MEHKYILKAYMEDTSVCRDLVCARLWGQVVSTRSNIPIRLQQSSNYGAVNGFPVTVWLEDEFLGLYTMNLHKDDDLYVMAGRDNEAVMISNAQTMPESLFMEQAVFEEDVSDWEIEFSGGDDTWIREHFNELIRFVINSDDATFRESLSQYLDVDAAIDYLLFIWTMGLENNAAKDLVMLTYGDVWIPTVYDMEDGLGLACDADGFLPTLGDSPSSATGSLLWDRLLQNFTPELLARYRQLRDGPLSESSIANEWNEMWDSIPQKWRDLDLQTWPGRKETSREEVLDYIHNRLSCLDSVLLN